VPRWQFPRHHAPARAVPPIQRGPAPSSAVPSRFRQLHSRL